MDSVKKEGEYISVLTAIRDAVMQASPNILTDTLWMPGVMSETVIDFIDQALIRHVDDVEDERERCGLLCDDLARMLEENARKLEAEGSYTTRSVWPPFRKVSSVLPRYAHAAAIRRSQVEVVRVLAQGCREGWDPRKKPNAR